MFEVVMCLVNPTQQGLQVKLILKVVLQTLRCRFPRLMSIVAEALTSELINIILWRRTAFILQLRANSQ